MIKNFDELIMRVKEARRGTAVIAAAQTESVLDAAILAKKEGLAESILVGDAKAIQELFTKRWRKLLGRLARAIFGMVGTQNQNILLLFGII